MKLLNFPYKTKCRKMDIIYTYWIKQIKLQLEHKR